jgi:hypothetical protein
MSSWVSRILAVWSIAAFALGPGCLAAVDFVPTCDGDEDCGAGSFCRDNHCSDICDQYSDCGTGNRCDVSTSKCAPLPLCTVANAATVCGNYACNTATGICYENCQGANYTKVPAQCGPTSVCTSTFDCIASCTATYDATCSPYVCDTTMGYCNADCSVDADCASGFTCNSWSCTR